MVDEKLLALKKKMNRKRPVFIRQDYRIRIKVSDDYWRKPRGCHSKMRRGEAGKRKVVQAGYRSPAALRGINLKGFKPVRVETMAQLAKIKPEQEIAVMASNLGLKKKVALVKFADEKNIKFANIRDAKKFLADVETQMKARKEARKAAVEKKTKVEKKTEKKIETKEVKKKPEEKKETKMEVKHETKQASAEQSKIQSAQPKAGVKTK